MDPPLGNHPDRAPRYLVSDLLVETPFGTGFPASVHEGAYAPLPLSLFRGWTTPTLG